MLTYDRVSCFVVVKWKSLKEIHCRVTIRAGLFSEIGVELILVYIRMAVDAVIFLWGAQR